MASAACPTRRQLLAALGSLALAGCAKEKPPAGLPPAVVPLASLPPGARVRVEVNGKPVEVARSSEGALTALSLLCTHQGCEVFWAPEESAYLCPCHEGRFRADGSVAGGPPTAPLAVFRVERRGADVVVGS